jgi:hypothetical protein
MRVTNIRWLSVAGLLAALVGCGEYIPSHVMNSPPAKMPSSEDRRRDSDRFITVAKPVQPELKTPSAALVERPYTEWSLHETAAEALARTGAVALPELAQRLRSPSEAARLSAAQTLSRMGPDAARSIEALEALVDCLENPQESAAVRRACARAIGQIGPALTPVLPQPPDPPPALAPLPRLTVEQMLDPQVALWHEREQTRRLLEETRRAERQIEYAAARADFERRVQIAKRAAAALLALAQPQEVAIAPPVP